MADFFSPKELENINITKVFVQKIENIRQLRKEYDQNINEIKTKVKDLVKTAKEKGLIEQQNILKFNTKKDIIGVFIDAYSRVEESLKILIGEGVFNVIYNQTRHKKFSSTLPKEKLKKIYPEIKLELNMKIHKINKKTG